MSLIVPMIEETLGYEFYPEVRQEWSSFIANEHEILKEILSQVSSIEETSFFPLPSKAYSNYPSPRPLDPIASQRILSLHNAFIKHLERVQLPLVQKWYWPRGHKFAVVLTHDIDRLNLSSIEMIIRMTRYLSRGVKGRELLSCLRDIITRRNPIDPNKIVSLEEGFRVKSTFFAMIRDSGPYHFRTIDTKRLEPFLNHLTEMDFEAELHASYDTYIDTEKIANEKSALEYIINRDVKGVRQHWLHFRFPDTLACQEKAGMKYDSSMGFNEYPGFRGGMAHPFHPIDPRTGKSYSILELPLALMDSTIIKSSLNLDEAWRRIKYLIAKVTDVNGILVVNWHNSYFDEAIYSDIIQLYRMLLRETLDQGAWVTTAGDVACWWEKRSKYHLSCAIKPEDWTKILEYPTDDILLKTYLP